MRLGDCDPRGTHYLGWLAWYGVAGSVAGAGSPFRLPSSFVGSQKTCMKECEADLYELARGQLTEEKLQKKKGGKA